jgi:hypothetical protein
VRPFENLFDIVSPDAGDTLTLQDSRKRRTHTPSRKKPQDSHDRSQRQTLRRHENVNAKYVENHSSENRQSQRHVLIRKQQDGAQYLQRKDHHVKLGHEQRSKELRRNSRRRRHVNKTKEPVEPERQKNQTE